MTEKTNMIPHLNHMRIGGYHFELLALIPFQRIRLRNMFWSQNGNVFTGEMDNMIPGKSMIFLGFTTSIRSTEHLMVWYFINERDGSRNVIITAFHVSLDKIILQSLSKYKLPERETSLFVSCLAEVLYTFLYNNII